MTGRPLARARREAAARQAAAGTAQPDPDPQVLADLVAEDAAVRRGRRALREARRVFRALPQAEDAFEIGDEDDQDGPVVWAIPSLPKLREPLPEGAVAAGKVLTAHGAAVAAHLAAEEAVLTAIAAEQRYDETVRRRARPGR